MRGHITCGTLFLNEHEELVRAKLGDASPGYIIYRINAKWSAVLLPGNASVEAEQCTVPMIYFANAEEYGWGFILFYRGEQVAKVSVDYELVHHKALNRFDEETPDEDPYSYPHDARLAEIEAEVARSAEIRQAYAAQFKKANPDAFLMFDLTRNQRRGLRRLLDGAVPDRRWSGGWRFLKHLGAPEFLRVSCDNMPEIEDAPAD